MKKFFGEFKKFITRGNVVDMAVGVIVGSSFTAIVNALSNNILKPVINYLLKLIFGANSLSEVYTFLGEKVLDAEGNVDLTQSIYIDWGAFINAIINFLIVAFVLFCIVKAINTMRDSSAKVRTGKISKEDKKAMKAQGIKLRDKEAVKAYFAEKAKKEEEAKLAQEAAAKAEREANPTTEDLLKQIRDLLKRD
ncbi:MAG: large conductance mechanosensitive channel protein MscL [Ruminococcaceae bacterium]|nr:large conductance mechanosensitive channel protein MscL [Oscillospiraceae bacterium]